MCSSACEKVVFVSNSPALALGLDPILSEYAVVCADNSSVIDLLSQDGVPVFCLERQDDLPGAGSRNSGEILSLAKVRSFIHRFDPAAVVVFKNSAGIEEICKAENWRLVASPAQVGRKFENKLLFPGVVKELGLLHPPMLVCRAGELTLGRLHAELGLPAVLQYAKGFSGRETFLISDEEGLAAAITGNENRNAKCTPYIPGYSLTTNGCVTSMGVLASDPFIQITGLPELTRYQLGSCGQDWSYRPVSEATVEQLREATDQVGRYFGARGYRGIFGLDFVVDLQESNFYVIEANPRLVASVPIFTDLQRAGGEIPLLLWHLDAFGWGQADGCRPLEVQFDRLNFERSAAQLRRPRPAAQLILHNLEDFDQVVTGELSAGVYTLEGEKLKRLRPAAHLLDDPAAEGFLVLPAGSGQVIHPGIECARLQFPHSVLEANNTLTGEARSVVKAVYQALDLKQAVP